MMFQSGAKMARSCTWRNFLSQKCSKLCHDPSSISFDRLFYIYIWKITKLKLTTSWSHSGFQRSIGTIMSFCCKYLKSEMIRCVGSFTSCDLARSKRLTTSKDSQSILLISLLFNGSFRMKIFHTQQTFNVTLFSSWPNYTN